MLKGTKCTNVPEIAMILGKCAIVASLLLALGSLRASFGADNGGVPSVVLPTGLEPYSDEARVTDAVTTIIGLLGTARFGEPPADSALSKPPCNGPEVQAFYRGLTLMQAGYFMFINKMERGFESIESPHVTIGPGYALVPSTFGSLVKPGRELLVGIWTKERLARLASLMTAVRSNPPAVKADIAAYFTVLLEFGDRYESLKRRAARELTKLNNRSTQLYMYQRRDALDEARRKDPTNLKWVEAEYPDYVFYKAYAGEMRKLLNANRDLGQEIVSECFDGGEFAAAVRIGSKGEITYDPYGFYPTSYMVGFWQRREFEGTTQLARFVIGRLVTELKSREN